MDLRQGNRVEITASRFLRGLYLLLKSGLLVMIFLGVMLYYVNYVVPIGNYRTLFYCTILFLMVLGLLAPRAIAQTLARKEVLFTGAICGGLLTLALLPCDFIQPRKAYVQHIAYFFGLVFSSLYLLRELPPGIRNKLPLLLILLFSLATLRNLVGILENNNDRAFYWNRHFLGQFCLFSLAVFSYAFFTYRSALLRLVWVGMALILIFLLIESKSRPSWIALMATIFPVISIYCQGRLRWVGLLTVLVLLGSIYQLFPVLVADYMNQLLGDLQHEERAYIWRDALHMQLDQNITAWLLGHGPGSYLKYFSQGYNTFGDYIEFPHNFVLEVLFESGLIGLTLVTALYGFLFLRLHRAIRAHTGPHTTLIILLAALLAQFIFTFLTLPFYSRYVLLTQPPLFALTFYLVSINQAYATRP